MSIKKNDKEKVSYFPDKLIPLSEYLSQKNEWTEYCKKVCETKAGRRFSAMRKAYKSGNLGLVKAFAQKAREQREAGVWDLVQPSFPDPLIEKVYRRLGIKEDYRSEELNSNPVHNEKLKP